MRRVLAVEVPREKAVAWARNQVSLPAKLVGASPVERPLGREKVANLLQCEDIGVVVCYDGGKEDKLACEMASLDLVASSISIPDTESLVLIQILPGEGEETVFTYFSCSEEASTPEA